MTTYDLELMPPVVIAMKKPSGWFTNQPDTITFRFTCDHVLDTLTGSLIVHEETEENDGRKMVDRMLRLRGDPSDQLKNYPVGDVCGYFIPHLKDSEIDSEFTLVVPSKTFRDIRADAQVGKFPSSVRCYGDDGQSGFQNVDQHLMLRTNQSDAPIFVLVDFSFGTVLVEKRSEKESSRGNSQEIIFPKTIILDEGATLLLKQIRSYLIILIVLALIYLIHRW